MYTANLVGGALLLYLLLSLLAGLGASTLLRAVFGAAPSAETLASAGYEALAGALRLAAIALSLLPPFWLLRSVGRRQALWPGVPFGKGRLPLWVLLPLFLGCMLAANSLSSLLGTLVRLLFAVPAPAAAALPATFTGRLFTFLSTCVAAPLLEEVFFRGAVQGLLHRWGARFALVATAVVFTLAHSGDVWQLPAILALGLVLGYVTEISGSLLPCVALHAANNLMAFLVALARENMSGVAALALALWLMLLLVALFVAAVWWVRQKGAGRRLLLPKEPPAALGALRWPARLLHAYVFLAAALALAVNLVVQAVSGG